MRRGLPLAAIVALAACGKLDETPPRGEVWRATSARIDLSSFGFWQGGSGYSKTRAELTRQQLEALDGLRIIPTPQHAQIADSTSYRIRITDFDGTVADYRAAWRDYVDGDESQDALQKRTVQFDSLRPFLDTFDCSTAHEIRYEPRTSFEPANPTSSNITRATKLPADLGCQTEPVVPPGCSDSFLLLEMSEGGTYELSDSHCIEQMSLRLYSGDGITKLAESTPSSESTCFTLRYAFAAGNYLLQLIKTNAAGCGEKVEGDSGSTRLAITRVP